MTTAVQLAQQVAPGVSLGFKNRLINGAMVIDQRNAGASVTITGTNASDYVLDRWFARASSSTGSKISVQRSTVAPTGFINSQLVTSLSAYTIGATEHFAVMQSIEGFNVADLGWGTANAQTITISFKVRSSLTGTFGGFITNSAGNRCYVFSYTINSANTFEDKTVTIAGDTSGTWLTDNGVGLTLSFSVGAGSSTTGSAGSWGSTLLRSVTGQTSLVGTNGATFYITGVQLEVGTAATNFEFRDYGRELIMCQRYYEKAWAIETAPGEGVVTNEAYKTGIFTGGAIYVSKVNFVVTKRASPTITYYRPGQTATAGQWGYYTTGWNSGTGTATDSTGVNGFAPTINASLTSQNAYIVQGGWVASAEL